MPIITNRLDQGTFDSIRKGKAKKGRYSDGDNLYIQVSASGSAAWVFRYRMHGKKRPTMGLGSCQRVGLKEAREKAKALRLALTEKRDPLAERRAKAKALPFDELVKLCLEEATEPRVGWLSTLTRHASPTIGALLPDQITVEHMKRILTPIWTKKIDTAVRVQRRIKVVLDFAKVKGMLAGENPARWEGCLEHIGLTKPSKVRPRKHLKAMKYHDAPTFLACLYEREEIEAAALEFAILTNVRSSSITGIKAKGKKPAVPPLRWSDIDFANQVWIIPKVKMDRAIREQGERFRVPLCDRALAVLERIKALGLPGERVFPMGKNAMWLLKDEMGIDATVHGFRTSFKTWATKARFPRHVIETAMAHKVEVEGGEVEGSYLDTTFLEERRKLMDAWSAFLSGGKDNVVPMVQPAETEPGRGSAAATAALTAQA